MNLAAALMPLRTRGKSLCEHLVKRQEKKSYDKRFQKKSFQNAKKVVHKERKIEQKRKINYNNSIFE